MNYQKQIASFVQFFKESEAEKKDNKIGVEFEHFILDENLNAVSYFNENGIESILEKLSTSKKSNWQPQYEEDNLISLTAADKAITLEPGSQLELSIKPQKKIKTIEKIYMDFIEEISKILADYNYKIAALGYQPKTSIAEIKILPKKRYDFMYKYFKDKGQYAHNMMKGTASLQMSIDYQNETDYIKKLRVGYFLSPIIYYLFDNTAFFEGQIAVEESIRSNIWDECDKQRSGIIEGVFDKKFGYQDYAEYLLNTPPIFKKNNNQLVYTAEKKIKEVMKNNNQEELEHFISMVFPDIRTKKYIEIRSADALPYPYNFAFTAFLKGLFYDQNNLDYLFQKSLEYNQKGFLNFKNKVLRKKEFKQRTKLIKELIRRSQKALTNQEGEYLDFLKNSYNNYGPLKFKTLSKLDKENKNIKEALDWCILN